MRRLPKTFKCIQCGKSYVSAAPTAGCCSDQCRFLRKKEYEKTGRLETKWYLLEKKEYMRKYKKTNGHKYIKKKIKTCAVCGDKFVSKRRSVACSEPCKEKYRKDYRKDYSYARSMERSHSKSERRCRCCGKMFCRDFGQYGYYWHCSDECFENRRKKIRREFNKESKSKQRINLGRQYIRKTLRGLGFRDINEELITLQRLKIKALRMVSGQRATRIRNE
jgi:hypothetical protein